MKTIKCTVSAISKGYALLLNESNEQIIIPELMLSDIEGTEVYIQIKSKEEIKKSETEIKKALLMEMIN